MKLVLFDLDNTLLKGDSDYAWGQFLIEQGVVERELHERENQRFYQQYKEGTLDIDAFLAFQLRPLAGRDPEQLRTWHAQYMTRHVEPMITPQARALVNQALGEAELVAIITATNRFVTAPIAAAFGVTHLIATEPETRDERYTGKVLGTPCFQSGKITRLHEWLHGMNRKLSDFEQSWFYSDSHNDLPLLEQVSHPVAVNPDPVLKQRALAQHWPILPLHDD